MRRSQGFTLLEVMIALGILSMLSVLTVSAIQGALKAKVKVQRDIDKNSTLRDALRIIERDVNMAFNYRDINVELYNQTQKQRQQDYNKPAGTTGTTGATGNPGGTGGPGATPTGVVGGAVGAQGTGKPPKEFPLKQEKIFTQFIGMPDQLDLTTVSNVRMTENSPISSQSEVGYKIKSCRRRSTQEQSSKCLWRRVSNYIHEDIQKTGDETVLLENVTEFKLRYLGPGKSEEWVDTWNSSPNGGDDTTKNKFPYAVEVTIEMKDPSPDAKDKVLRMTTVAALRNPNNPPKKEEGQAGVGVTQ